MLDAVGLDFNEATSAKPAAATADEFDGDEGPGQEVR
jgi:hypothetical protein